MTGKSGPMNTAASTRSGLWLARKRFHIVPADAETVIADSVPVASITASASSANSFGEYAASLCGRSERPLPRPSKVTTRKWRAR